ncbi:MAG: 3'-5' exonuclease, partial [Bacteroidota bacterium]
MNRFAIVDIETTGSYRAAHSITEIAIIVHDGKEIIDSFQSLINPMANINPYVSRMTGITNEMLRDAPKFHEIAKQVWNLTDDAVFIAHSVNFDFSYIRDEFKSLGADYRRKKLCTVRLSRKIFPGYPSYSLGNICTQLGIKIDNRHRAMGDASATAKLFELCVKHDSDEFINKSLKKNSKEALLPPHLPKEVFENLPEKTGVYYFHD